MAAGRQAGRACVGALLVLATLRNNWPVEEASLSEIQLSFWDAALLLSVLLAHVYLSWRLVRSTTLTGRGRSRLTALLIILALVVTFALVVPYGLVRVRRTARQRAWHS